MTDTSNKTKTKCEFCKKGQCELPGGESCFHKEYTDYEEWCGLYEND